MLMEIALGFLVGLAVGLAAHVFAIYILIKLITENESFAQFISNLIAVITCLATAVVLVYVFFAQASILFVIFAASFCFTLLRVADYEEAYKEIKGYNLK